MKTKSFKDLIVWQKAFKLVKEVYCISKDFPKDELYGLTQQMKRAAISIPSNIAEGYGRNYQKEYAHALSIAYGSLCELETQYLLSLELAFTQKSQLFEKLLIETGSMLYRMMNPKR